MVKVRPNKYCRSRSARFYQNVLLNREIKCVAAGASVGEKSRG